MSELSHNRNAMARNLDKTVAELRRDIGEITHRAVPLHSIAAPPTTPSLPQRRTGLNALVTLTTTGADLKDRRGLTVALSLRRAARVRSHRRSRRRYLADGSPDVPMTASDWDDELPAGRSAQLVIAPLPQRFAARLIDLGIGVVVLVGLAQLDLGTPGGGRVPEFGDIHRLDSRIEFLIWGIFSFSWSTLWIATRQATPGKLLLGLRFVDPLATGTGVTFSTAVNRSVNKLVPAMGWFAVTLGEDMILFTTMIIAAASFVLVVVDDRYRTLMDRVASTTVIKR